MKHKSLGSTQAYIILAYAYDYLRWVRVVMAGSGVGVLDKLLGRSDSKAPFSAAHAWRWR